MTTQVLPPANGKKLWRVKRSPSVDLDRSTECLNNSLKISAAAGKFTVKRPPLRRPKNKPGKPKDFVFVDLSPIKDDEPKSQQSAATAGNVSPLDFAVPPVDMHFDMPVTSSSDDESLFSLGYDVNTSSPISQASSSPEDLLGLGISWEQPVAQPEDTYQKLLDAQETMMAQYQQIQMLQEQLKQQQQQQVSQPLPKKTKGIQFKSYQGPQKVQKRRVASAPTAIAPQQLSYEMNDFLLNDTQFDGLDTSFDFGF
ncbi:hypothetical protein DICA3_D03202 [Diutina catenulata]